MQSRARALRGWAVRLRRLLRDVDGLLRGRFTRVEALQAGRVDLPVRTLVYAGLVLGGSYGLFLLTLAVTFPSLYVFSALVQSRLGATPTLRLLLAAVSVNLALLASFGPVTGFFTLSTNSYPFIVCLNVAFFTVSGITGLVFLRRALDAVFEPATPGESARLAKTVFRVWIFVYAVVGAQMAWILRPFIGTPNTEFTLFRARDSNFFAAVFEALRQLLA